MAHDISIEENGTDEEGNTLFTITMDDDMHATLDRSAKEAGMDIDAYVSHIITEELKKLIAEHQAGDTGAPDAPSAL